MNVRSFPKGALNCYTLKPEQGKGNKYLIRAFFMYGNYDSKNQLPVFNFIWVKEILHGPKTYYMDVCQVNIGSETPFIAALELRQLDNKNIQAEMIS
ncbi:hypothetical protein VitviT2T_009882 [Vitis vinifera]|uniref:Malectin-like domain-containing protein n=1 Tax=Vitis vinifera TaxID=29760 RepID=A0ABY9C7B3_VITVI|nr:hypothetical protein VitviT2T_009882 [Vitis vinifera]